MNPESIFNILESNKEVFRWMLANCSEKEIKWRPAPEKWNLLDVICHLYDEEREDFRARLRIALETPGMQAPKFDTLQWVDQHHYQSQLFTEMIDRFLKERDSSIAWLRSLVSPDWNNTTEKTNGEVLSAGLLVSNWLAHDYFHFRQITRLRFGYLEANGGYPLTYAGNW